MAINREDLICYATKGNGVTIPAFLPVQSFGHDPDLAPYSFDPDKASHLLREAGYPEGLALTMIASEDLEVQATVVSKMLEQVGLKMELQILDSAAFIRKIFLSSLEQPSEEQTWDIALTSTGGSSTVKRGHEHHRSMRRFSVREGRPRGVGGVQRGGGT